MRGPLALAVVVGWGLACAGGEEPPPPAPCPEAPECPSPAREVIVVPVFADGEAEHWCCAWDQDGARRYALLDGPAACREQYGDRGGAWTEGPECIPCCCRTAVSETDASKGFVYERTSPVACAGVGECLPGDDAACDAPPPRPGGPGKAPRRKAGGPR